MASNPGRQGRGVSIRLGQDVDRTPEPREAPPQARPAAEATDSPVVAEFIVETLMTLSTQLLTRVQEAVDTIVANEESIRDFQHRSGLQVRNLISAVDALSEELQQLKGQVGTIRRDSKPLNHNQILGIAEAIVDEVERRQDGAPRRRARPLRADLD